MEEKKTQLPENAHRELKPGEEYKPLLSPQKNYPEVTPWSVTLGIIMTIIFSAAAAYLGLKVGQVFEAAIPIAIIAVGLSGALGRKNALGENVMIQSIGSCSGAIVAGAIFTLPALFNSRNCRCSKVTDIAEVEAALHTHRHLALDDLQQGVGGLTDGVVIGAQDAAGVDHTGLQAHDLHCIQHHLGSGGLRLGISAYNLLGVAGGELGNLGDGSAVGQLGDGTGGGDVDHLLALRVVQNLGDDIPGAAHVDGHQLLGIVGVHGDHGGAVDHHGGGALGDCEEGFQRRSVRQIAQNHFHLSGDELHGLVIGENQRPDLAACFQQLHADIGAQETGSTGQQIITIVVHFLHLNLS